MTGGGAWRRGIIGVPKPAAPETRSWTIQRPRPTPTAPPRVSANSCRRRSRRPSGSGGHTSPWRAPSSARSPNEGKRVGILAGIAIGLLFFAGLLLPVGLTLFLGEWLFGSIGWGLLLGLELAIGGAVILVLAALYVPGNRIAAQLLVALVVGIVVAVLLALDLPHRAFTSLGTSILPSMDPGPRPLVVGLATGLIVGALVGLVVGLLRRLGAGGTIGAAIGLAILGLFIGAIVAIDFSLAVAIALGLAVALALWPALVGIDTYRRGLDIDGLKKRFYPRLTIETTKETIEWVRKQRPLGPKS